MDLSRWYQRSFRSVGVGPSGVLSVWQFCCWNYGSGVFGLIDGTAWDGSSFINWRKGDVLIEFEFNAGDAIKYTI